MGKIQALLLIRQNAHQSEATVSDVITFNGHIKKDVLACASGIESFLNTLAQSVIKEAKKYGLDPHTFTNFEAVSGKGLKGDCLVV
jgi:cation transport ATPase